MDKAAVFRARRNFELLLLLGKLEGMETRDGWAVNISFPSLVSMAAKIGFAGGKLGFAKFFVVDMQIALESRPFGQPALLWVTLKLIAAMSLHLWVVKCTFSQTVCARTLKAASMSPGSIFNWWVGHVMKFTIRNWAKEVWLKGKRVCVRTTRVSQERDLNCVMKRES